MPKKGSKLTLEERIERVLNGCTWEEAEQIGIKILAKNLAKHQHVDGDGQDYYKKIMMAIANKSIEWARENTFELAMARVGKKMQND